MKIIEGNPPTLDWSNTYFIKILAPRKGKEDLVLYQGGYSTPEQAQPAVDELYLKEGNSITCEVIYWPHSYHPSKTRKPEEML